MNQEQVEGLIAKATILKIKDTREMTEKYCPFSLDHGTCAEACIHFQGAMIEKTYGIFKTSEVTQVCYDKPRCKLWK